MPGSRCRPSRSVPLRSPQQAPLRAHRDVQSFPVRASDSLVAPLLSVSGVAAFAVYLWAHAGTPFAYTQAQKYGWDEKFDLFAIGHLFRSLADEISFSHFNHPTINLNLVVGAAGVIVLVVLLVLLFMRWRQVSVAGRAFRPASTRERSGRAPGVPPSAARLS